MKKLGHNGYFNRLSGEWRFPVCSASQSPNNDKQTALFKLLFSMDENGIVHDALGKSLSGDVRPEVSDFIRDVLMRPNTPVSYRFDNLSDDDIAKMSPNDGESVESFQERLMNFVRSQEEVPKDD